MDATFCVVSFMFAALKNNFWRLFGSAERTILMTCKKGHRALVLLNTTCRAACCLQQTGNKRTPKPEGRRKFLGGRAGRGRGERAISQKLPCSLYTTCEGTFWHGTPFAKNKPICPSWSSPPCAQTATPNRFDRARMDRIVHKGQGGTILSSEMFFKECNLYVMCFSLGPLAREDTRRNTDST